MTRRKMLAGTGATLTWLSTRGLTGVDAQAVPLIKNMGGEGPGFAFRSRAGGFDILEHCHNLGLGAVRLNVPQGGPDAVRAVRQKLDAYGMRSIISVAPPRTDAGVAAYDAAIAAARELGAVTTHASFTQRRYEEFDSVEASRPASRLTRNRSSAPSPSCASTR